MLKIILIQQFNYHYYSMIQVFIILLLSDVRNYVRDLGHSVGLFKWKVNLHKLFYYFYA